MKIVRCRPMVWAKLKVLVDRIKHGQTKSQTYVGKEFSRASLDMADTSPKGVAVVQTWIHNVKARQGAIDTNYNKWCKVTLTKMFTAVNHDLRMDLLDRACAGEITVINGKNEMVTQCELAGKVARVRVYAHTYLP
jgi:hypothetical protein